MQTRVHHMLDKAFEGPLLGPWRRRRFDADFAAGGYRGMCRGIFDSHAAAAAAAPATLPLGYDNPGAAAMYRDRLDRVYPADYPMMLWLERAFDSGATRVFDLGGHVGIAYYAYRRYLRYPAGLRWVVHDVPAVIAQGQRLAQTRDRWGTLEFVDEAHWSTEAAEADIFFTSGCLQYLERSLAGYLEHLTRRPAWVLVNMLPLHEREDFWTVQSIGRAFCPYHIQRRDRFFADLAALGYQVRDVWENAEKRCNVAFADDHDLDHYHGVALTLSEA